MRKRFMSYLYYVGRHAYYAGRHAPLAGTRTTGLHAGRAAGGMFQCSKETPSGIAQNAPHHGPSEHWSGGTNRGTMNQRR